MYVCVVLCECATLVYFYFILVYHVSFLYSPLNFIGYWTINKFIIIIIIMLCGVFWLLFVIKVYEPYNILRINLNGSKRMPVHVATAMCAYQNIDHFSKQIF